MSNAVLTLIVLAVVAFFFVTELLPLAVTAMAGAIAVGVLGIIPMNQVFSGLSNSTVVLFAAMFVVGAAMFHTGLAQKIGEAVVRITGTGENSLMIGTMVVAAALSSVTSNTATTGLNKRALTRTARSGVWITLPAAGKRGVSYT